MKLFGSKPTSKKKWIILAAVISFFIMIRIALPFVVLHYANKTLARMHGYWGHIDNIDISLLRGAYVLKDFHIDKVDTTSKDRTPFISSKAIDLSVEWTSLLQGQLVGEVDALNPVIRFTKDKVEPADIQKDTNDFRKVLKSFMPLKINRLVVHNGKIQYIDSTSTPTVNIWLDKVHILAQNLTSVKDTASLPATVVANANLYGGDLTFKMKMDPMAIYPSFDMNAELANTNLPDLNDLFQAYASIDVNKGTFGLYTELASKDQRFIGYVKPIIKDLDVVGPEDKNDSFGNKIWEGIVGTAAVILKNPEEGQIATKIPMEGNLEKTTVNTWYAALGLLRNAFIQAIKPAIDYQINLSSVDALEKFNKKNLVEKIFTKTDDKPKNIDKK
ncbi:AsmA family protein [Williamwhitmania taraxaci]|uniref:DUF748 domain-containing protein n=1 Tax=Williamwhitmania taraxaci TaxID=1640674 RepID=A0A1G6QQQ4_9BACT|nr:DUF748 domain-containing protein [Williamwhitmania taraxaci]SDC94304.1 protein of unknown function [Williamwhitmania taraxaci]